MLFSLPLALVAGLAGWSEFSARRIAAEYPPIGQFVAVPGGRLHVLDIAGPARKGSVPTLVFVHGASSNLRDMALAFRAAFAGEARLIFLDRPGQGWSDRPHGRGDADPAVQAAAVAAALDALDVEKAVIVAHSLGGAVGAALAVHHPEKVAGLALIGGVTHPWSEPVAWYYGASAWPVTGLPLTRLFVLPVAGSNLEALAQGAFWPQRGPERYAREAGIAIGLRPTAFIANGEDVTDFNICLERQVALYPDIRTPTVVLHGDADRTVSIDIHARPFAAVVPDAELIVLPGIGHMPHYVAPEPVQAAIRGLMQRAFG